MSGTVFTSTIGNALKRTLEEIVTDESYEQAKLIMKDWCDQKKMKDNYEDDLEVGGPGLASEKPEGTEISTGTITEGVPTRYIARTFALKLIITEEAIEDNKYEKVLEAAMRLRRSMFKTVDIDATNILVRATDANYPGGDGQPLGSATHTLPHGGTFSNLMAVPVAPSVAAVITATTQIRKFPGHDGITEGYEPWKIVCPEDQWATWAVILKSTHLPETNEFNAINVANQELNLSVVSNRYWNNTTTNWGMLTDCDYKINFRWRRKPRGRSWADNDNEQMKFAISARWARGWSDPRAILFVDA